ncbi:MAG: CapA family protein [Myxococcales bacterium]|nr:CapA family protein [Myxococcales bacterium]MCB9549501.1 CapA family protein [Myxococcales bacterium]
MRTPLTIWMLALALVACDEPRTAPTSAAGDLSGDGEDGDAYDPLALDGKADGFEPPTGPLVFAAACEPGDTLTIAAVGDVLLHGPLQQQAYASPDGFGSLWAGVADLLAAADVTYANLEGPTAAGVTSAGREARDPGPTFDGVVYSSYPQFNYHPRLVADLQAAGVDVVSTANNHSLDRRALGADRTLEALEAGGLPYTGTRRSDGTGVWHTYTEARGFRLAWLACTYGTNGIPDPRDQVLLCFEDRAEVLALVAELAAEPGVDAVIVTPHWGQEYQANPAQAQVDLAHDLLEAGATAVIGSHPHVLQPWERYVTASGREGFVIYSLGNFVSGQSHLPRRSTLLLYLGLTRTAAGVRVNGARYVPLHMTRDGAGRHLDAIDRVGGLADSRALTVGMFKGYNLLPPSEVAAGLVTNPQCDPAWQPPAEPHPHDGWIGGACVDADACGGGICLADAPGGLCSEPCERFCPDRAGRVSTFCVDLGFANGGVCVAQCGGAADCRPGYTCVEAERYGDPATRRRACLPAE